MSLRYRELYNIFGVFASDTATGYHALDVSNNPVNTTELTYLDTNRIAPLDRINSFGFTALEIAFNPFTHLDMESLLYGFI